MATAPTAPTPAAEASSKKRLNVLRFNIAGYIPVNSKQMSTITKASDAFNAAITALKAAGGKITRDEEPEFTTVAADTGEE